MYHLGEIGERCSLKKRLSKNQQNLKKYALVIARFWVQYGQYFPSFSYFADLFHKPLGERNKSKIWKNQENTGHINRDIRAITTLSLT